MRKMLSVVTVMSAGLLLISGCSSADDEGFAGLWATTEVEGPELELQDGGDYTGNDGCNTVNGTWEQDGDDVVFSSGVTTLKACPDIDVWMEGFASGTVNGSVMTLFDDEGVELGTLTKAD